MKFFLKKRRRFLSFLATTTIVLVTSFFVEMYGFGSLFFSVPESERGFFEIGEAEMRMDGFVSDEKGGYVSDRENASLTFSAQDRFVQAIHLDVGRNIQTPFIFSYLPLGTDESVPVKNALQSFMEKREKIFGSFLIFHVGERVQSITITMPASGTEIGAVAIDNVASFNPYRWMWVFGIGFLFVFFGFFWKEVIKKPEIGFFVTALVCGSVLVFSGPREAYTWDEKIHYDRSVNIARFVRDIPSRPGATPSSYSLKEFSEYNAYTEDRYVKPKNPPKMKDSLYMQIGYVPSAFALIVGETLPLPHTVVFLFGRWFNLLVFATVVFFAIRKLKSGKMIASSVALLPTSLFLASNYDYDWWVTAFLLLGLSYLFSALQQPEKKITNQEMIIMIGAFVLGLGPKPIYFPLMFLLFFLQKEKFADKKRYKKFLVASTFSIFLVAASFLFPFLAKGPGKGDVRGGGEVNATEQVQYIISHPIEYSGTLLRFMGEYLHPQNATGYTTFFAYLGSFPGSVLAVFALLLVAIFDRWFKIEMFGKMWKFTVFLIFFSSVALITTALYVTFTAVGSSTVSGVQPRYLIPLLFPFLFAVGLCFPKFSFLKRTQVFLGIGVFSIFSLLFFFGLWEIVVSRYY